MINCTSARTNHKTILDVFGVLQKMFVLLHQIQLATVKIFPKTDVQELASGVRTLELVLCKLHLVLVTTTLLLQLAQQLVVFVVGVLHRKFVLHQLVLVLISQMELVKLLLVVIGAKTPKCAPLILNVCVELLILLLSALMQVQNVNIVQINKNAFLEKKRQI